MKRNMRGGFEALERIYRRQEGRVGYLVLWLLGAPLSLLFILWIFLGNNLIGKG